jgi:hypothetical protein
MGWLQTTRAGPAAVRRLQGGRGGEGAEASVCSSSSSSSSSSSHLLARWRQGLHGGRTAHRAHHMHAIIAGDPPPHAPLCTRNAVRAARRGMARLRQQHPSPTPVQPLGATAPHLRW